MNHQVMGEREEVKEVRSQIAIHMHLAAGSLATAVVHD